MKTANSQVSMPWSVKVVWWWYLTLACASCVPLVFCLVKGDPFGRVNSPVAASSTQSPPVVANVSFRPSADAPARS